MFELLHPFLTAYKGILKSETSKNLGGQMKLFFFLCRWNGLKSKNVKGKAKIECKA